MWQKILPNQFRGKNQSSIKLKYKQYIPLSPNIVEHQEVVLDKIQDKTFSTNIAAFF